MTADDTRGFPVGYFVIRSIATGRVLDVEEDSIEDGGRIVIWPEKESSLVESLRDPNHNNQVFFIDTSGALCSRSSGHAIDAEGNALVLRHRRPISYPFPNSYAHPLPIFNYDPKTCEITLTFLSDPAYPLPSPSGSGGPSQAWKNKTYLLTAVPKRKPRTIMDDAADFFSNAVTTPLAFIGGMGGMGSRTQPRPEEVFGGEIDLDETEILEEERGEEAEVDDSPEPGRELRIVGIPWEVREKEMAGGLNAQARMRRMWEVVPLRIHNARTGGL